MRYLPTALAVFFVLTIPAIAQTVGAPAPVLPVANATDTIVTVPIGNWADTALGYLTLALGGFVVWGFRLLPPQLYAIAMTMRADQLMTKALAYALNSVAGAAKDKVWTVNVRNQVLKEVATYALVHGADAVKAFIGTPADMAEKGFARIAGPVDTAGKQQPSPLPDAPKPDFDEIGAQAKSAAVIQGMKAT
jgi:hypothetical protein